jgi:S1-C subfamily serine protease
VYEADAPTALAASWLHACHPHEPHSHYTRFTTHHTVGFDQSKEELSPGCDAPHSRLPPCRPVFITNHHIFGSAYDATLATAQCGTSGRSFTITLRPDVFFKADQTLDYAAISFENPLGKDLPFLTLATRREVVGEPVQITGYPECAPVRHSHGAVKRAWSGRGGWSSYMAYGASTLGGSSGSPVIDKRGEVTALHRHGSDGVGNLGTPMAVVLEHVGRR